MTDGSGHAPAGWYNDPHSPDRMRYFDGEVWTDHFHQPGKLPDIGSWLSSSFTVFAKYWQSAAVLALIVQLVAGLVIWGGLWLAVGDVAIVNEELVNFDVGTGVLIAVVLVLGILLQGFSWLAMSRFLHRAHFQANPTVADAFSHAVRRLPRYLGIMFLLVGISLVAVFVWAFIAVAVPTLGVLLALAAIPLVVWLAVKLAFVINAVAIAPRDSSPIQASFRVSVDRFWPVLGRVLLFSLVVGVVVQILNATLGQFGQFIDPDVLSENVQVRNDQLFVSNFELSELLPSSGQFLVALLISSVIQAASGLVMTSAFVRLYLDSGAPAETL